MANPNFIWAFPWFTTPNAPDLGCFVRNEHPFEVDSHYFLWQEFAPWEIINDSLVFIPHQVYVRIKCGKAAYYQRIKAWQVPYEQSPIPFLGLTPDYLLGGDHVPMPSDWIKFPVQSGARDYWFAGEYRNPAQNVWQRDAGVGHSYDRYDNGTLSTVGWDDTGGDKDYNDLVLEVAVVYRRSYFNSLDVLALSTSEIERFEKEVLPKFKDSPKKSLTSAPKRE